MWILPFIGYIGILLGFAFLTLAIGKLKSPHGCPPPCNLVRQEYPPQTPQRLIIPQLTASGLYYLSELVEEHTVLAKKLLTRLIYSVITFQILLVVIDRFPVLLSFLSIGSHVVYLGNLRRFPIVKLSDPLFILSCCTLLLPPNLLTPSRVALPPSYVAGQKRKKKC